MPELNISIKFPESLTPEERLRYALGSLEYLNLQLRGMSRLYKGDGWTNIALNYVETRVTVRDAA
jgi:hypothetical protein